MRSTQTGKPLGRLQALRPRSWSTRQQAIGTMVARHSLIALGLAGWLSTVALLLTR